MHNIINNINNPDGDKSILFEAIVLSIFYKLLIIKILQLIFIFFNVSGTII